VADGDTLASIADHYYGDSSQWKKIYDANKAAIGDNPDAVKVGTKLTIPPK
jgi:nucleoid-associated protein YgaU